jgi:hypothetical protein
MDYFEQWPCREPTQEEIHEQEDDKEKAKAVIFAKDKEVSMTYCLN